MKLIGTFLWRGSVFAVYSREPITLAELWDKHVFEAGDGFIFPESCRVIPCTDSDPPPTELEDWQ